MTIKINSKQQKSFFDNKKNRYDESLIINPPYHTECEIKKILTCLKNIKNSGIVMDFGAGNGRLTIPLLQNKFHVLSVDISGDSLIRLKNLAKKLRLEGRLKTARYFPKGNNYTAIVGTDILHHIDMDHYLGLIYRSLKKGGRVIFSEPGACNIAWYIYLPIFISWEVEKGVVNCSIFNLRNKFKKYGFKNIKIKGLGLFPRSLFNFSTRLCSFNDWLGNLPLLRLFAYRYIIDASK